jgi:hypothetical protein
MEDSVPDPRDPELVRECCYSECTACRAEIFAVVGWSGLRVVEIGQVGLENEWPDGFPK